MQDDAIFIRRPMPIQMRRLAALLFSFGLTPWAAALAAPATVPMEDDGVMLKIPASIFGQSRSIIVDTGCSTTILDRSFVARLGPPSGQIIAQSPYASDLTLNLYGAPKIQVGQEKLPLNTIAAANLQIAHLISGEECAGVIGMNVLSKYLLVLDFAGNHLTLNHPADTNKMVSSSFVPMVPLGEGRYAVSAILNGSHSLALAIDSGSSCSISLNPQDWKLVFGDDSQLIGRVSFFAGVGNNVRINHTVRVKSLRIGTNLYTDLLCSRLSNPNSISHIGLGLLRRNFVTLDCSNQRLGLVPRPHLPEEQDDMSGLHLLLENGQVTVYAVDFGSPADRAGIKAQDVIISLNGRRSTQFKMQEIRNLLQQRDGMPIQATVDRNGQAISTSFNLKSLI